MAALAARAARALTSGCMFGLALGAALRAAPAMATVGTAATAPLAVAVKAPAAVGSSKGRASAAVAVVANEPLQASDIALPPRSATNPQARPAHIESDEKASLDARYKAELERELGLFRTLDRLDQDADAIETSLARSGARRADATDALREAELRRARAERRLSEMRAAVRSRLRAVLRLQRSPELRFAVSPEGFASAVVQQRLLGKLLEGDRVRLQRYREQLARLTQETAERDRALRELEAADRELHGQLASLERARHDKLALIAQIEADRRYHDLVERDLASVEQALAEQIRTFAQWRERRYTFGRTRGKLLRPVNSSRIELGFGPRKHPRFGTEIFHRGVDIRSLSPGPAVVRAVFWGRVAYVGWLTGFGTTIILDHGRGWHSVYAHVEQVAVEVGEVVRSRQRLALVGSSGSRKGKYLYFEIRERGQPIDPSEFFH